MVFILDGISEIGAHWRSHLCYFSVQNIWFDRNKSHFIFSQKIPIFLHACACLELPSNIIIMKFCNSLTCYRKKNIISFDPEMKDIFRQHIPENSWRIKTFCCRCPYLKKNPENRPCIRGLRRYSGGQCGILV